MKKLLCAVLFAGGVACHQAPPPYTRAGVNVPPGAPTPAMAVRGFFDAVHAGDLQAMSLFWGTDKGSSRETIPRAELEKREVILQCYFNADSYTLGKESDQGAGRRALRVELVRGRVTRATTVNTVMGPGERWYVESLDMASVRDFCGEVPRARR